MASQAQALSCAPEVARLTRLPQGVRATVTLPLPRTAGHMSHSGLTLFELTIGTVAGARALRPVWAFFLLGSLLSWVPAAAMQTPPGLSAPQELAVPSRQQWPNAEPTIARIWTYSCDAPVEVPFVLTPDLTRMHRQIEGTGRGIPPAGDFVWTSPRIVQVRAHILHFPPRTAPPYVYWLLHYRARGHVVAASELAFDWALIGALAADAFGEAWFSQGTFGIVQQGRVIQYGEAIGIPPHGAIIHLVRTSLQPRLGYTGWDAPADPGCVMPFDYDICLSAKGGPAIVLDIHDQPRTARAAASSATGVTTPSESDTAQLARHLERQIAEVSNDLQVLVTRLETAGVLPTPEVAPWNVDATPAAEASPPDRSSAHSPFHNIFSRVALGCIIGVNARRSSGVDMVPFFLAAFAGNWPGILAKDHDGDSSSDEPQPSEPSSPSVLEDVHAPTPLTHLATVPGESPVVRPNPDPLSSTSVPEQDRLAAVDNPGVTLPIGAIQHRFSCAIRGLPLSVPAGEPYIPASFPVIMHNPFTGRPQCRLRTTLQGTAQILCNTLADYASRRGWQPIVDVQPQPNSEAVHLIPAASRPDLVSVLLSAEGELHPMCISRSFPSQESRPYRFGNREGRVIAPYPSRRVGHGQVQLRDGECFPVNFGPFGPPPPQPVHDAAGRLSRWGLLVSAAFVPRWASVLLAFSFLPGFGAPNPEDRPAKPIYRISALPWRIPRQVRTAQPVCGQLQCRFSMLCPWTGQHGVYTADSHTPLDEVWTRYRQDLPGWPDQQYMPTWPGLRYDRLTLIPVAPTLEVACVVICQSYHHRAILIPACITVPQLTRAIAHLTPWQPQEVRLPPAVLVASIRSPAAPLQLRSGDVLEVLEAGSAQQTVAFQHQEALRGYARWTQGIGFLCTMLVRLWDATWPRPIVTWINPGTEWQPLLLTFNGAFQASYPGRWIPLAWGPSKILQFVRASDSPRNVHVLVEQEDRTFVTSLAPTIPREALASAMQVPADVIQIIGAPTGDPGSLCTLRDGDIINTQTHGQSLPIYGWPDDDAGEPGALLDLSCALLVSGRHRILFWFTVLARLTIADAVRSSQPDRSRSGSPSSDASSRVSPRPSRWRPDRPHHS